MRPPGAVHTCNHFPYPSPAHTGVHTHTHTHSRTLSGWECRDSSLKRLTVTRLTRWVLPTALRLPAPTPPHPASGLLLLQPRGCPPVNAWPGSWSCCRLLPGGEVGLVPPGAKLACTPGHGRVSREPAGGRWSGLPLPGQETAPLRGDLEGGSRACVCRSQFRVQTAPFSASAPPAHPAAAAHQGAEAAAAEALPGLLAILGADGVRRGGLR